MAGTWGFAGLGLSQKCSTTNQSIFECPFLLPQTHLAKSLKNCQNYLKICLCVPGIGADDEAWNLGEEDCQMAVNMK